MKNAGAIFCVILAFAVCGVAVAQDEQTGEPSTPPPFAFSPKFEERPFAPLASAFPMMRQAGASALLCCRPRANRTLTCRVERESQNSFGETASRLVQQEKLLTEESYAEYRATAPASYRFAVPVTITLEGARSPPPLPEPAEQQALCAAMAD